jgi:hypothetical protein
MPIQLAKGLQCVSFPKLLEEGRQDDDDLRDRSLMPAKDRPLPYEGSGVRSAFEFDLRV